MLKMKTKAVFSLLVGAGTLAALPAQAESVQAGSKQISVYSGAQTAPHSRIKGQGGTIDGDDTLIGWEGNSFEAPPYYGIRATWWTSEKLGFGVDFNHAKVYAPDDERAAAGYDRLEFTDGLNILTVNAYRRFPEQFSTFTPYVGGGLGVAIPHVDVTKDGVRTYEYQLTGPAVTWLAGVEYPLNDRFALFGEYKGTYSQNEAELDDGGTLESDIVTNALNLGVSFNF